MNLQQTEQQLTQLLGCYSQRRSASAIPVNFRKMLAGECFTDSLTHTLHPYPAKLLMHIPYFFLHNTLLSQPGDNILDVFTGSGTVLLEAIAAGRNAYGADCNPLARFISTVKTKAISPKKLNTEKEKLLVRIPSKSTIATPDVHNIDYWFYPHIIEKLKCIREAIVGISDAYVRDFFAISFSKLIKYVSLADPRLTVPVKLKHNNYPSHHWLHEKTEEHKNRLKRINVIEEFAKILNSNIGKMADLWACKDQLGKASIIGDDAKNLHPSICKQHGFSGLAANSVQMVITSPPYPGAQKYIRSSFLHIGWLEMAASPDLLSLKASTIGREEVYKSEYCELQKTGIPKADRQLAKLFNISPIRAGIATIYLNEMREVIDEIYRVLKPGGFVVLIAANSEICKNMFPTQDFLREIFLQFGFKDKLRLIDDIKSRGLMTKRNKTAGIISREWVHLLEK